MKFWEVKLPNKIYNLDYEVLTTNQDDETKKLIQHLGLDWEKNACHLKIIEGVLLQRLTCKLGIKFTKVVRSNGKNINHSLMEHLIILTIN